MTISKVISTAIEKGKLIVKVLRMGASDVQTGYNVQPFGIDSRVPKGYRGIFIDTANNGDKALIGVISESVVSDGEVRLHSEQSDGSDSVYILLKNNEVLELNGNTNFAVRFNELETGFNQMKSDLNSLISTYNTHIHITTATVGATAVPGVIAPTVSTGTPTTASIASAKNDKIKTN